MQWEDLWNASFRVREQSIRKIGSDLDPHTMVREERFRIDPKNCVNGREKPRSQNSLNRLGMPRGDQTLRSPMGGTRIPRMEHREGSRKSPISTLNTNMCMGPTVGITITMAAGMTTPGTTDMVLVVVIISMEVRGCPFRLVIDTVPAVVISTITVPGCRTPEFTITEWVVGIIFGEVSGEITLDSMSILMVVDTIDRVTCGSIFRYPIATRLHADICTMA